MNETDEETAELTTSTGTLLSGSSLLQLHVTNGRNLPKDGSKDFSPSNSWMEKKQIQSALDERHELLKEERVEKWGCMAGAIWDNKKKLAEITRRIGKYFETLGFEKNGTLFLYPEEALYLLEMNSLELTFGGVPVSLQQGYALLLGANTGCSLIEYRAYSHLLRQGYKLLRFTSQKAYTKYERLIRLDQHTSVKRCHPGEKALPISKSSHCVDTSQLKTEDESSRGSPLLKANDISFKEERNVCISKQRKDLIVADCALSSVSGSSGVSLSIKDECSTSAERVSQNMECLEQPVEGNNLSSKCNEIPADKSEVSFTGPDEPKEQPENPHLVLHNVHIKPTDNVSASSASKFRAEVLANPSITEDSVDELQNQQSTNKSQHGSKSASNQESRQFSSMEVVKTRAYGIAECLVSLGNVLMEKNSNGQGDGGNLNESGNLSDSLQSEIIKVLGPQLDTSVSKESLASVAASAANTILSHISSEEKDVQDTDCGPDDAQPAGNVESYQSLISTPVSSSSFIKNSMNQPSLKISKAESDQVIAEPQDKEVIPDIILDSNEVSDQSNTSVTENYDMGKDEASQPLKRQALPHSEIDGCEPVLIKRAKVTDICEPDIEILDFVPEEKQVEVVNLSDESSVDSSEKSEETAIDNDGIEVIDVLSDSSSSDSSESVSSSSGSDGLSILEEKNDKNWEYERRRILETIPNMYNLAEICVVPPNSDLLPRNVRPQRNKYIINRSRLLMEGKGTVSRPLCLPNQLLTRPRSVFELEPQEPEALSAWSPDPSINPMALQAVQAIAQLVLPMIGLTSNALPPDQMWLPPNNAWLQPRPSWCLGPRFNTHPSRGMKWQRSRPRQRGYRQFSPRYQQTRRAFNHSPHFSPFRPSWNCSTAAVEEYPQNNELIPLQSTFQEVPKNSDVQEFGQWYDWKKSNMPTQRRRGRKKGIKNPRYFKPPQNKKWVHFHKLLLDKDMYVNSETNSPAAEETRHTSSEESDSESSEEDSKSRISVNLDVLSGDSENTSSSGDSTMEVKPLLSPRDCTSFASAFKAVQVIKEADTQTIVSSVYEHRLKPQYDLFSPSKPFRKGNPPLPDFHLCIVKHDDAVPTPGETQSLLDIFDDSVPLLFAIVSPDSMSFVQFSSVSLPKQLQNV